MGRCGVSKCLMILPVLTMVMLAVGCAQPRPLHVLRSNGDAAFERGEYLTAADAYGEIVDRRPGDWEAQFMLGRTYLELSRPYDARRALEIAASHRPSDRAIGHALARAMYEQGAGAELFSYLRSRASASRDPADYMELARYAMDLDDMDAASQAILTAIEFDGGRTVQPYLLAADFSARLGNTNDVIRRLRQAYGISRHDARVVDQLRQYGEVPGPTLSLPPGR